MDLGLHCVTILSEFLNALFLIFNESSIELDLELMTGLGEIIECLVLNQVHFVVILLCGLAPMFSFMYAEVIFSDRPLVVQVFHLPVEVELPLAVYGLILELLLLDLVVLRYHDVDLRVEYELLPDYFELEFVELLDFLVIVATHLLILLLQERYVLEARLLVVKETADARLLLIFNHFLLQDLKLELHEVDLLLEVRDVLIVYVPVRVDAQGGLRGLVLTVEIHRDCCLEVAAESRAQRVETRTGRTEFGACTLT